MQDCEKRKTLQISFWPRFLHRSITFMTNVIYWPSGLFKDWPIQEAQRNSLLYSSDSNLLVSASRLRATPTLFSFLLMEHLPPRCFKAWLEKKKAGTNINVIYATSKSGSKMLSTEFGGS